MPSLSAPKTVGVPSISQRGKAPAQSKSPRFSGFLGGFVESAWGGGRAKIYIWYLFMEIALQVVLAVQPIKGHTVTRN